MEILISVSLVLILILLEDTLRDDERWESDDICYCLNPYSTGRYSTRLAKMFDNNNFSVLILILLEDTLRENLFDADTIELFVLILILLEDTLRDPIDITVS